MRLRKEIGSEFWNVPTCANENGLFPENTIWFLSGRSALHAIIKDIQKKMEFHTVAMPDWCCDSMILPFINANISVKFYQPINPISDIDADVVLLMDYFGYTGHSEISSYDGIVIRDLTHSIFSKKYDDADYYFGSLRKWAGFWTGGYAWGFDHTIDFHNDDLGYTDLRKMAMQQKSGYIEMRADSKDYLSLFEDAEERLEYIGVLPGIDRDVRLAESIDIKAIKAIRRRNAQILLSEFSDIAIFPGMSKDDCPMFVPIVTKNRNELRRFLIQNEIYCPVHWPISVYHKMSRKTKLMVDRELSLVCDQRYDRDDMYRLVNTIKMYGRR